MERRVFVTLLVCTLFTLVYLSVVKRTAPPARAPDGEAVVAAEGSPGTGPAGAAAESGAEQAPGGDATEVAETLVPPFESDDLRVEFSSLGAAITQVYLKRHFVTAAAATHATPGRSEWVSLFPQPERSFGPALTLRELATPARPAQHHLDERHWELARDDLDASGARTIEFHFRTRDGHELWKRFVCRPGRQSLAVTVGIRSDDPANAGKVREFLLRAAGGISDVERGQWTLAPQGAAMLRDQHGEPTVRQFSAEQLDGGPESLAAQGNATVAWGGCTNLYFAALLAPDRPGTVSAVDLRARAEELAETIQAELVLPLPVPRDGAAAEVGFTYYVGPKDPALLAAQGLEVFEPLIEEDYGSWTSFRWINKLLLLVLRFFHGFVGNWGVAIVLLTLLVRICIFPITRTQQVSMQRYSQKMQVLKPKLDALKEKFKDKPQKFAQEQMKLLKEHNARPPLLGCLSMLVTFPVFIGMFQILRTGIELRQASFVGWIDDLSQPDAMFEVPGIGIPFNLLPILATAAFVGQMVLAPKPADPQARQQQKIMYFMPVVFGVMFYNYAAGLSLYMLTSSLYGMFEYKVIRKRFFPAT